MWTLSQSLWATSHTNLLSNPLEYTALAIQWKEIRNVSLWHINPPILNDCFCTKITKNIPSPCGPEDLEGALSFYPASIYTFNLGILSSTVINFDLFHSEPTIQTHPVIMIADKQQPATCFSVKSQHLCFHFSIRNDSFLCWTGRKTMSVAHRVIYAQSNQFITSFTAGQRGGPFPFSPYKNSEVWSIHGSLTSTFVPVSFCSPF